METAGKNINYWGTGLLAMLLFFCNTAPVLHGLSMAFVLLPLWIYLIATWKLPYKHVLGCMVVFITGYAVMHLYNHIIIPYYIISSFILIAAWLFAWVAYHGMVLQHQQLDRIFKHILILNFVFALLSLPLLFLPHMKDLVWYTISISANIEPIPRLKLFTSEASHYALLLAPVFIYFCCRAMFMHTSSPWLTLAMIGIPLLLSFSLGVWLCLLFTGALILLLYYKRLFQDAAKKKILIAGVLSVSVVLALLWIIKPDNPLFQRLSNLWHGKDTSARGRTYESFLLAHRIIGTKSYLFGIGPGQLKVLGRDMIIQFYQYIKMPDNVRIPNACADTMVCYGYLGLVLRLGIQTGLFFKTAVTRNPFRLWLFLFLFCYQFTGSYISNTTEYMLWALAFAPVFTDLEQRKIKPAYS